tara:strand:- start:2230 stop:2436 length:207 start_codon:yes stop_codon:yes gene_type:complete
MYKVEGEDGLYRDPNTNAIVNKDTKLFEKVRASRVRQELQDQELKNLKDEITELRSLLRAIINRSDYS